MADDDPVDPSAGDIESDRETPLDELADHVRRRREAAQRDGDAAADPFAEEAFEALEGDALWETVEAEAQTDARVESGEAEDEHVVPKRSYCERCEYLSDPPEVSCTHPGTTIVEFVDADHVRVRSCPVVAERLALGGMQGGPMTPNTFGRR